MPAAIKIDVAVVRFPRIANFTDADALAVEPAVAVRFVDGPRSLGRPDLVILPGTKATVADLDWLRGRGLDRAIQASGAAVLGVCGGYQMLGRAIVDTEGVESPRRRVDGLGWLDAETTFSATKHTRQRRGRALGQRVCGYQIHHGRVASDQGWIHLDDAYGDGPEGATSGRIWGTTLHGLLEEDGFRASFLAAVAPGFLASGASFAAARHARLDRLADLMEAHLDMALVERLLAEGAPVPSSAWSTAPSPAGSAR